MSKQAIPDDELSLEPGSTIHYFDVRGYFHTGEVIEDNFTTAILRDIHSGKIVKVKVEGLEYHEVTETNFEGFSRTMARLRSILR